MLAQSEEALFFVVDDEYSGERLDKVLARLLPSISRARLQTWIEQGAVTVNGVVTEKIRLKVSAGDEIEVLEQPSPEELAFKAGHGFAAFPLLLGIIGPVSMIRSKPSLCP